ncbi:MAG: hypothetical protein ACTSRU_17935 [Candidatus Hodarchaeales archaeon]
MADKSISGKYGFVYQGSQNSIVDTGALDPNVWCRVLTVGASTALPVETIGQVFETPDTSSTAITLAVGDSVEVLDQTRRCKTEVSISGEEGTIDVTDDCSSFTSMILDGFPTLSGSIGSFVKFDEITEAITAVGLDVFSRFFDVLEDDGEGVYTFTERANEPLTLFYCLNSDAKVGEVQNWVIIPVLISGFSGGAGNKDAQKSDLTFTKAEGPATFYKRTVFAADLLS